MAAAESGRAEARIRTIFVDATLNQMIATLGHGEAGRGFAPIEQRLDGRDDGHQPGRVRASASGSHRRAVRHTALASRSTATLQETNAALPPTAPIWRPATVRPRGEC